MDGVEWGTAITAGIFLGMMLTMAAIGWYGQHRAESEKKEQSMKEKKNGQ